MTAYLEASVISTLFLRDAGWENVAEWITRQGPPTISDFGWGEFVSAVSQRLRRERLPDEIGHQLLQDATDFATRWRHISLLDHDIAMATDFVRRFDLKLRLPDAIHLAIGRRIGQPVITGDIAQAKAARALGIPVLTLQELFPHDPSPARSPRPRPRHPCVRPAADRRAGCVARSAGGGAA